MRNVGKRLLCDRLSAHPIYEIFEVRLPNLGEPVDELQSRGILLDGSSESGRPSSAAGGTRFVGVCCQLIDQVSFCGSTACSRSF